MKYSELVTDCIEEPGDGVHLHALMNARGVNEDDEVDMGFFDVLEDAGYSLKEAV